MIKKCALLAVIFSIAFISISCSPSSNSLNKEIQQKLDNLMEESMITYKSPGMILAVWSPGEGGYVKAMGLADIKTGRKLKSSDPFRIGSNTKIFTSTVILQLVDENKLKLEDKLSKFFPKIPNSENITIRMLLNHTSGLFDYSEDEEFGKLLEGDPLHAFTPRQLIDNAIQHKPYFSPGKEFHYSNTNTVLLGMIVGKITGSTLEREIKKRIIDKLHLKNTIFPAGAEITENFCRGYMLKDGKYEDWTKMNVSWGWAAGAMISNIYDMRTFITAVTDGSLLSRKLQKERMSSWVPISKKTNFPSAKYGYNIFTYGGFVGHNGGLPGYISYMVRDPENGETFVMMLNIQPEEGDASLQILKRVINIICPENEV